MNSSSNTEIRAILDSSALVSYTKGHVHVGEVIREVADEDACVIAIPAAALAAAHAHNTGNHHAQRLLVLLTTLPGIAVLSLAADTAASMAGTLTIVDGDISLAHAVWTANKHRAVLFTTRPADVEKLVPHPNVIVIPLDDA
jgi:hypothetical protein